MQFLAARPERGAMRPYVPGGTAMDIPVETMALPRLGILVFSALLVFVIQLVKKKIFIFILVVEIRLFHAGFPNIGGKLYDR